MIVLIIHCLSHILLQYILLHSVLDNLWSLLNHRHLSIVSVHVAWLKFVLKVLLIPSRRVGCEDIRLVDFVVSSPLLVPLLHIISHNSVFAGMAGCLSVYRGRLLI